MKRKHNHRYRTQSGCNEACGIIDMGKDRGHGGKILFKGIPKELIACKKLIPARTLRESVP